MVRSLQLVEVWPYFEEEVIYVSSDLNCQQVYFSDLYKDGVFVKIKLSNGQRWYDSVSNNEVLRRTGLLAASSIVRKRRLGLFGHVARLTEDVPANQILRTCCEAQDGARPSPDWKHARGRPPITWIHQICRDTVISLTDALQLAEDRSFWRQIATAECYGWTLRVDDDDDEWSTSLHC